MFNEKVRRGEGSERGVPLRPRGRSVAWSPRGILGGAVVALVRRAWSFDK